MIKKIWLELLAFTLLLFSIFITRNIDVGIYNYFAQQNYGFAKIYLKEFFVNITELGDSLWYFLIFIVFFLISFLANKTNFISFKKYFYLKRVILFSFFYLLLVGIVTQIIKHLIGRPRPNHTNYDLELEFNFFTMDSSFHSFPSGHSSTIIAISIIASLILPNLKIFFYFCALLVALSRVVVGAHFLSDVIAGGLVAIMVYKFIDLIFVKKYPKKYWGKIQITNISALLNTTIVFFVLAVFITLGPNLDIYLSSFFYYGNNQFVIQSYYIISIVFRKILLPVLLFYIFVIPIMSKLLPLQKIFFNHIFSYKEIFFIWISGIATLIVVVNILLKNMWGRARPNDILQFGGNDSFTPWYKFGDSCLSNCSFVSGDASVGFLMMVFYFIIRKNFYFYLAVFLGTAIGIIRIMAGGHFFSDIVFSQIVVTLSLSISFILYKKLYAK